MIAQASEEEPYVKILVPVADYVDKEGISRLLYTLSALKRPLIVLIHVVEAPSRTTPVDPHLFEAEVKDAEARLNAISGWLSGQGYRSKVKVVVARSVSQAIIEEANSGSYAFVFLMKRKRRPGLRRLLEKSVSEAVIRGAKCFTVTWLVDEAEK